jgi:hypothetical protein
MAGVRRQCARACMRERLASHDQIFSSFVSTSLSVKLLHLLSDSANFPLNNLTKGITFLINGGSRLAALSRSWDSL